MSLINSKGSPSYIEALEATESIQSPALGFINPESYRGATSGQAAQIKQSNTIIHLLVQINNKLEDQDTRIRKLEQILRDYTNKEKEFPEEIIRKLDKLSLGESSSKREQAVGKISVFTDPRILIEKAKEQVKKQ